MAGAARAGEPRRLLALVFAVAAGGDRGAEPRRDRRAAHAGRVRHRGAAAHQPAPARLRVLAPGQLGLAAAAGLEPHQPARLPRQRALVPALRGADGAADGSPSIAVEWVVLRALLRGRPRAAARERAGAGRAPAAAALRRSTVVGATLAGFAVSSARGHRAGLGRAAGAVALTLPRSRGARSAPRDARARRRAGLPRLRARPRRDRRARRATTGSASAVERARPERRRRCPQLLADRRSSARCSPTWSTTCRRR